MFATDLFLSCFSQKHMMNKLHCKDFTMQTVVIHPYMNSRQWLHDPARTEWGSVWGGQIKYAHSHLVSLCLSHSHPFNSHEHASMLIVNPHRQPSSLSHSLSDCICLLPHLARAYSSPRFGGGVQAYRHNGRRCMCHLAVEPADVGHHLPHVELWKCTGLLFFSIMYFSTIDK